MLSPQEKAELRRIEREKKAKEKKAKEEEEQRRKRLEAMNSYFDDDNDDEEEEEEQQEDDNDYDDDDDRRKDKKEDEEEKDRKEDDDNRNRNNNEESQDGKNDVDKNNENDNKSDRKDSDKSSDGKKADDKNKLDNNGDSGKEATKEAGHNNAPNSQGTSQPQAGGSGTGSATPGQPATTPTASPTPAATGTTGTAATGTTGTAVTGTTGTAVTGTTGTAATGTAATTTTGTAAAPVLLVVLLVVLILILFVAICGLISNALANTAADYYDYEFNLEDTTLAQIIKAREDEKGRPLLRFNVKDHQRYVFFSMDESDMKDLLYNNMNKYYDDIVKVMVDRQAERIVNGKNISKASSVGEAISISIEDPNGDDELEKLRKYGTSGFSIQNYFLFLTNEEFVNSMLASTLSTRSIQQIYTDMEKHQGGDTGDVRLKSISKGFKDLILLRMGADVLANLNAQYSFISDENKATIDDYLTNLNGQYLALYQDYLKTDLTFALVYKYLFSTFDQFNSIVWNVYGTENVNGTRVAVPIDFELMQAKGLLSDNGETENLYIPDVYINSFTKEENDAVSDGDFITYLGVLMTHERYAYEKYIDEVLSIVNPYLMHWIVPYSINVATNDYTFALDVMYNMRGPISLDVYKLQQLYRTEEFCIEVLRDYTKYDYLYYCSECNDGVIYNKLYTAAELEQHFKDVVTNKDVTHCDVIPGNPYDEYKCKAKPIFCLNEEDYKNNSKTQISGSERLHTFDYPLNESYKELDSEKKIMFYHTNIDDDPSNKSYDELLDMFCGSHVPKVGRDVSSTLETKLKYAEGMYQVTYNEWEIDMYIEGRWIGNNQSTAYDKGLTSRIISFDTGSPKVESVYRDILEAGPKNYTKTYKLSYLDEDDYNRDGTRANSYEKINRIEWFLDYGAGENEMFPDKKSKEWYDNYTISTKSGEKNIFTDFYHISFNQVAKVIRADVTPQVFDYSKIDVSKFPKVLENQKLAENELTFTNKEGKSVKVASSDYLAENFCTYLKLKYKYNIDSLTRLMNSDEIKKAVADINSTDGLTEEEKVKLEQTKRLQGEMTILQYINGSTGNINDRYAGKYGDEYKGIYNFEIASQADKSSFVDNLSFALASFWNWFCGNTSQAVVKNGYYSNDPVIDACYRLNTVQGYDFKELDFAFVEIESYYNALPTHASDALGNNVVSEEISSLPAEGLAWPVQEKNGSKDVLDYDNQANTLKIKVKKGEENKYKVIAALDGTVYVDEKASRILLLSTDNKYLIIYEGVAASVRTGDTATRGQSLGTVNKTPLIYRVAFNIDGFEVPEGGMPSYKATDLYDPLIFYNITEDENGNKIVESVTGSSGEYAVKTRTINGKELRYKVYKQRDAYYSETYYGYGGTIGKIGCPLIATANALSALGYGKDPGQIWDLVGKPAGSYGVTWACQALGFNAYDRDAYSVTRNEIISHLQNGGTIVFHFAAVDDHPFSNSGHWMSITDYLGGNDVIVNDGNYGMFEDRQSIDYIIQHAKCYSTKYNEKGTFVFISN